MAVSSLLLLCAWLANHEYRLKCTDACCALKVGVAAVSGWTMSGLRRASSRRFPVGRVVKTGNAVSTTVVVRCSVWLRTAYWSHMPRRALARPAAMMKLWYSNKIVWSNLGTCHSTNVVHGDRSTSSRCVQLFNRICQVAPKCMFI